MSESAQEQAIAMRRAGQSLRQIAKVLGVSATMVHRWTSVSASSKGGVSAPAAGVSANAPNAGSEPPARGVSAVSANQSDVSANALNVGSNSPVGGVSAPRQVSAHTRAFPSVHDPVARVMERLDGIRETTPDQWEARCPAHEDRHASLAVSRGEENQALLYCHAGCTLEEIVAAAGLQPKDLFVNESISRYIEATYDYCNLAGELLYQVVRFKPKKFMHRRPDGQGDWVWNVKGVPRVLYRWQELAAADPAELVFIPEGEKDVESLRSLGFVATCNSGGAKKWKQLSDDTVLNGRRVAIIPDVGQVGIDHAMDVARRLLDRAAEVRIVPSPEGRKDVSKWIEDRDALGPNEFCEGLLAAVAAAPVLSAERLPPPARADPGPAKLGERDPATGRIVLSARRTLPTAKAFVNEFFSHADGRTLHSYAGLLLQWSHNRYAMIEDEAVKNRLQDWLDVALRYVTNPVTRELELVDFDSNPTTVKAALDSLRTYVHLSASISPPTWLADPAGPYEARDILPCLTCNLHLPTQTSIPPTPRLFNMNALDFDFDPKAPAPDRWLQFLTAIWGDDHEQISLLQEWFGYCLTADTAQQKMLLMIGPKRSGKGTIGRVLTRLMGVGNVAGPTTSSLAGAFGLQPLIGKSLAIVSDARFSGDNIAIVVERLLCISGEDALTIDRKFLSSVTMKLPTRFMFLTNELPRLTDASGALAGRFLFLQLKQSFYGREDTELTDRLLVELPGILNWAIEGWWRLRQRGKFVQPASVADAIRDTEDLASPVLAFVRDRCILDESTRVWADDLYEAWRVWCESDGRFNVTTKQVFGRDLRAAVPGLVTRRGSANARFYEGLQLKVAA